MDLREKFISDLFDVMHDFDKGTPRFKDMHPDDKHRARILAQEMVKKGWYCDIDKAIR